MSCNLIRPRADVLPIRPDCRAAGNELTDILVALYGNTRAGRASKPVVYAGENLPMIARKPYFQQNGFTRAGLYPDDFTGRNICALSRAQSWIWKPALRAT